MEETVESTLIKEVKERSENLKQALSPLIDQIALLEIKKLCLPPIGEEEQKSELLAITDYYHHLICQVLNIERNVKR